MGRRYTNSERSDAKTISAASGQAPVINYLLSMIVGLGLLLPSYSFAQSSCAKDGLGRVFCAPPGGSAVPTINGVACGLGACVVDGLGRVYCSSTKGGGASLDNLGRPLCVGGCIAASPTYCQTPSK